MPQQKKQNTKATAPRESSAPGTTDALFSPFFNTAAKLTLAIHHNLVDHKFVTAKGGKINFVVDANVMEMYFNPSSASEAKHVITMGSDDDLLIHNSIITSEYLFSGKLVGQRQAPMYLLPGHRNEVDSKLSHSSQVLTGFTDRYANQSDLGNTPLTPKEKSGLVVHLGKLTRYQKLRDRDAVVPVEVSEWATQDIIEPPSRSPELKELRRS